jgi:hypothetical protein
MQNDLARQFHHKGRIVKGWIVKGWIVKGWILKGWIVKGQIVAMLRMLGYPAPGPDLQAV